MATNDGSNTAATEIRRWQRRFDRERASRLEAERIAEAGLLRLYEANLALDERVRERTEQLSDALAMANAANDSKSEFLGHVSHQLRTPLNGLLGTLELLGGAVADEQAVAWHASAVRSAERLQRFATRLIGYVDLEHRDLTAGSAVPIASIVDDAIKRWSKPCRKAGQLLMADIGGVADVASAAEVSMLLDELLSNSATHAKPGAVKVVVEVVDDTVEMCVNDPGGRSTELVPRFFETGAITTEHQDNEQLGIGLAIVDRIVQGFGGQWSVAPDRPGSVRVVLPRVCG